MTIIEKNNITCKIFFLLDYISAVWELDEENHLLMLLLNLQREVSLEDRPMVAFYRPYLYSRYRTGTSLEQRLMRGVFSKANELVQGVGQGSEKGTFNCLISNREGLGTSLKIMGLATIDPQSYKVQTKLYKIPKLSKVQPFENGKINKEMYGHPDAVFRQRLDGYTFFFC